jgi:hypothetical protein
MNREEIYEAWVPLAGAWSLWARPVLFGQMSVTTEAGTDYRTAIRWAWDLFGETSDETGGTAHQPWRNIRIDWAPKPEQNAVLIVDLPGAEAVHLGLALAGHGYRPVPLYNGCTGPSELIGQKPILRALRDGAVFLSALSLPTDAPPAFLLDSGRQSSPRQLRPGMLDNRWQVLPDDLPSAQLLRQRGVSRALWIGDGGKPQADMAQVLRVWQEAHIALETKDLADSGPPHRLIVPPIPSWRRWWHRLLSRLGLRRSPRDGFGYIVPSKTHG